MPAFKPCGAEVATLRSGSVRYEAFIEADDLERLLGGSCIFEINCNYYDS